MSARAASDRSIAALELMVGDDATRRSYQDHAHARGPARLSACCAGSAPMPSFNNFAFTTGGARWCATRAFVALRRRGTRVAGIRGVEPAQGPPARRTTLVVDHAAGRLHQPRGVQSRCSTTEAAVVFQGKIIVRPHAQKTDAKMMTQALLLSDDAEADNKPELEIFADDVQLRPRRHRRRARRESDVLPEVRAAFRTRRPRRC